MDFPTILVILTAVTGAFWAWKKYILKGKTSSYIIELFADVFPVVLIVLLLRSFLFEPFRIPSGSMLPTLQVGDFIVVNKYNYGIRLPVLNKKIIDIGQPQRGDVVVFRHPQTGIDYIKRVMGVPGDVVHYEDKKITINGKPAEYEPKGMYLDEGRALPLFKESWHNDGEFEHVMILDKRFPKRSAKEWVVPEGQYFMLGDNRDNSNDSRFWGMVPDKDLTGKAFAVWMSWNSNSSGWFPIQWGRIGNRIQ